MTDLERTEALTEAVHAAHLEMLYRISEITADGDVEVPPALGARYGCLSTILGTKDPMQRIDPIEPLTDAEWDNLRREGNEALDTLMRGLE